MKVTKENIDHLPKEYPPRQIEERDISPEPIIQFDRWFADALKTDLKEPNAMTLATSTKSGNPSVRTVLLKHFDKDGFVFFTNYESRKGKELAENPVAALVFWWGSLGRQIRIEGSVEKVSKMESKNYFQSRPFDSKISAWASRQSSVIDSRESLEKKYLEMEKKFENKEVPLPPFWGGYRVIPNRFEFWQGWVNRLHDRIQYTRMNDSWKIERLAP